MAEQKIQNWPVYDNEEIEKVKDVLSSGKVNYWTGKEGRLFEQEFAAWVGVKYAVALANGSVALTAAYKSLGLKPGDEIITTSRTFIATSSTAILLGVKPLFADVDCNSGCLDPNSILPLINSKTKAICVVHLGGYPADMVKINHIAKQHRLFVIEDCAQAHGAMINNQKVGSFGDVAAWSFCQDKIMTTGGEGGMITTNRKDLWDSIWSYKDHGKTYDSVYKKVHPPGFRWLHEKFGTNYRLTEMQSAIGRIQLKRMDKWTLQRQRNAKLLTNAIKDFSCVRIPTLAENLTHAYYKFYLFIRPERLRKGWNRNRIINEINNKGFPAFQGSCSEIYMEKCFKNANLQPVKDLPVSKELGCTSIMLLVHPSIKTVEMNAYAVSVRDIIKRSCGE
tara:strand:+ start:639 stop:1817 length:1179 start_codon:yes stop_codon:yes gene_type:complete